MRIYAEVIEFNWDRGNIGKNRKHKVEDVESEEAFFDEHKVVLKDALHSKDEPRWILLGKTQKGRLLYIVFTQRGDKIRIISARNVNRREVPLYEEKT
jgi:uncharacterized DUF497 family protein